MGQKHKPFREFGRHFPCATSAKIHAAMYARVPQAMAQFVLKIEKLSHIMAPTPIIEIARAYGLHPRLWLLNQPNLVLRAHVPFGQHQDTEGSGNEIDTNLTTNLGSGQYVTHAHSHITNTVGTKRGDGCLFVCRLQGRGLRMSSPTLGAL